MKWKTKILISTLIVLILIVIAPSTRGSTSQTHIIDTRYYHFKLANDCQMKFDEDLIYLGDSNGLWSWINTDAIKFYNLMMANGQAQTLLLSIENSATDANITVTKLFKDNQFEATISASSGTTTLELSEVDRPIRVLINDTPTSNWGYDATTKTLTVANDFVSTSPLLIEWVVSESSTMGLAIIALTLALCALIFATKKRRDSPTDTGGL